MGFTGDNRIRKRPSGGAKSVLGGWITASASQHADNTTVKDAAAAKSPPPPSSARFGFLSSVMSPPQPASSQDDDNDDDAALLDLDIESALFPTQSSTDAFSPAAFKNLQLNAIGLLGRFQNAHRRRTAELRGLRAEHDAAADEREEAQTRANHLKLMLDDMARKVDEQEQLMRQLLEELAADRERKARSNNNNNDDDDEEEEDLGFDECRQQHWRRSNSSTILSMDTDFDSSDGASLFSQSRSSSAAMAPSTVFEGSVAAGSPRGDSSWVPSRAPPTLLLPPPPTPTPAPARQMTTLQKLFKGISGDPHGQDSNTVSKCRNCEGQTSAVAWDTVGLLRDENRGLKLRVEELQAGVDAALDLAEGMRVAFR